MKAYLPVWTHAWLGVAIPLLQITLIVLAAWLLRTLAVRVIRRLSARYELPAEVVLGTRKLVTFLVGTGALLLVLEALGVSGAVLWTAFTGFAAVAAIAFFAAWSVLSNIFCAVLLLVTRPFRLYDHIELLDGNEARGVGGQVVDMNLICVILRETREDGATANLRVPNNLFFQRVVRRWHEAPPPRPEPDPDAPRNKRSRPAGGGGAGLF
ncbi:mechanosensitive ion channel domain-containing protein [Luteimonas dalianensis]|uniref:mechanosensitive ion channel domain-containing protein n=1 Tax=Luteimonas dalianensis TaxID=1148196 RepID=UPI003BEFE16F